MVSKTEKLKTSQLFFVAIVTISTMFQILIASSPTAYAATRAETVCQSANSTTPQEIPACIKGFMQGNASSPICAQSYAGQPAFIMACVDGFNKYDVMYNSCPDTACKNALRSTANVSGGGATSPGGGGAASPGAGGGAASPGGASGGSQCGGVDTAIINCTQTGGGDIEDSGIWGILEIVVNIMMAGVTVAAVGGFAYGGILYASAQDNQQQVQKSIEVIRNVVFGLIAFIAMYAFLQFIIPGGVF